MRLRIFKKADLIIILGSWQLHNVGAGDMYLRSGHLCDIQCRSLNAKTGWAKKNGNANATLGPARTLLYSYYQN